MNLPPPPTAHWRAGLAYGALGAPLAFVALPLYVQLPEHHARVHGLSLASLGVLLLLLRLADAVVDPALGRWLGRRLDAALHHPAGPRALRPLQAPVGAGTALLLGGLAALFLPPAGAWGGPWATVVATALALAACTVGYSGLTLLHQAWGARLPGDEATRARWVAWREGLALAGVLTASLLPALAGWPVTLVVLASGLALALWAARVGAPRPLPSMPSRVLPAGEAAAHGWRWSLPAGRGFRRLLAAYAVNGVASAIPATLFLFFVNDRLQAPAAAPALLGAYFLAAAVSLPLWVRAVARWGLVPVWRAGMGLAVAAFLGTLGLGQGDVAAFAAVCLATGAALGADLAAPPALLAGWVQAPPGPGRSALDAGTALGWWALVTKLNLALAAGLALPLLEAGGYQPGQPDTQPWSPLLLAYAGLPCALKAALALALPHWLGPEPRPPAVPTLPPPPPVTP
ncbi:MFS transporter [Ideonella livida]|uniref:MFS transporter n=1 Tax=Ideonella livida TaxID=2707176 RepID=A0A7C9PHM0_9BURK|nr:MFS transporter [Ideonella livida]NDY91968.1 MFS transporter [Ideonella livida]